MSTIIQLSNFDDLDDYSGGDGSRRSKRQQKRVVRQDKRQAVQNARKDKRQVVQGIKQEARKTKKGIASGAITPEVLAQAEQAGQAAAADVIANAQPTQPIAIEETQQQYENSNPVAPNETVSLNENSTTVRGDQPPPRYANPNPQEESGYAQNNEYDEESDEQSDEESDEQSDEESDEESDEQNEDDGSQFYDGYDDFDGDYEDFDSADGIQLDDSDFSEMSDSNNTKNRKRVHPTIQDICNKLEWNKEFLFKLKNKRSQEGGKGGDISKRIIKVRKRIDELETKLQNYQENGVDICASSGELRPSIRPSNGRADLMRSKETRQGRINARKQRFENKESNTSVDKTMNPKISNQKIVIPPNQKFSSNMSGTGIMGIDNANDYDAEELDINMSNLDGDKKPKINWTGIAIGVSLGILSIYLLKKYKVI